jgi:hypothetical protein
MANECAIDDCETLIRPRVLMCHMHWRLVPINLRDAVRHAYIAWREGGHDLPTLGYVTTRQAAIDAVHKRQEGKR